MHNQRLGEEGIIRRAGSVWHQRCLGISQEGAIARLLDLIPLSEQFISETRFFFHPEEENSRAESLEV